MCLASTAWSQAEEAWRAMNQPVEPFRIMDNLYYVGASSVTAYLLTSEEGHVLIDGGFVETAPMILESIRKLGFEPGDVRILLNSHAHFGPSSLPPKIATCWRYRFAA
jgi:metallo-beta-lactamase class B